MAVWCDAVHDLQGCIGSWKFFAKTSLLREMDAAVEACVIRRLGVKADWLLQC